MDDKDVEKLMSDRSFHEMLVMTVSTESQRVLNPWTSSML
jgi:hypothetical protein